MEEQQQEEDDDEHGGGVVREEHMRGQPLFLLPNGAHQALLLGTGRLLESLLRSSASRTASLERSFFGLAVRRHHAIRAIALLQRNERTCI